MDKSLIDRIAELTGKESDEIQEMLEEFTVDEVLELIDLQQRGDDDALMDELKQLDKDFGQEDLDKEEDNTNGEDMGKKRDTKITLKVPKQRDPVAQAMFSSPKLRQTELPNKKDRMEKRSNKHKGQNRGDDPFSGLSTNESQQLSESVVSFEAMPSFMRMLELAGRPTDDQTFSKAVEDYMDGVENIRDVGLNDIAIPVGKTLLPGPVSTNALIDIYQPAPEQDFDLELDYTDLVSDDPLVTDSEEDLDEPKCDDLSLKDSDELSNIQVIRDAFASINTNLNDIKLSELSEVKTLVDTLLCKLNQFGCGNNITK